MAIFQPDANVGGADAEDEGNGGEEDGGEEINPQNVGEMTAEEAQVYVQQLEQSVATLPAVELI